MLLHRELNSVSRGRCYCCFVSCIRVPGDTDSRIIGENPLESFAHLGSAVGDDYLPRVKRIPDTYTATVME